MTVSENSIGASPDGDRAAGLTASAADASSQSGIPSAQHTPGPFSAEPSNWLHAHTRIVGANGLAVAHIIAERDVPLIAAATDLLDQLEKMVAHYVRLAGCGDCGFWDPEAEDEVIAARVAINKALGK